MRSAASAGNQLLPMATANGVAPYGTPTLRADTQPPADDDGGRDCFAETWGGGGVFVFKIFPAFSGLLERGGGHSHRPRRRHVYEGNSFLVIRMFFL